MRFPLPATGPINRQPLDDYSNRVLWKPKSATPHGTTASWSQDIAARLGSRRDRAHVASGAHPDLLEQVDVTLLVLGSHLLEKDTVGQELRGLGQAVGFQHIGWHRLEGLSVGVPDAPVLNQIGPGAGTRHGVDEVVGGFDVGGFGMKDEAADPGAHAFLGNAKNDRQSLLAQAGE